MQIKAHVRLEHGNLISAANASRIVARCLVPSDRMGNSLPSPLYRFKDDPPYFQTWKPVKESKGWIFREVTHGAGMGGHHKTLRDLVIAALCGLCGDRYVVEVV